MTMEFGSLADLAMHLGLSMAAELDKDVGRGLERAAEAIEATAKAEIGIYQGEAGPFPAWAPLAESTVADRIAKGFTPDDPLLRTGDLRDSIVHEVEGMEATIGSTDAVMEFMEFGTSKMPPRPVMGPGLFHNAEQVQRLIGDAAVSVIVGGHASERIEGYTLEGSAD
jgi:HK97 gp10 family phage protein